MLTKTQAVVNLTPTKPKEEKQTKAHTHTHKTPIITTEVREINNHWSLLSLNINGLDSPIRRHRLTE